MKIKKRKFNKQNWTGEEANIKFRYLENGKIKFNYFMYKVEIEIKTKHYDDPELTDDKYLKVLVDGEEMAEGFEMDSGDKPYWIVGDYGGITREGERPEVVTAQYLFNVL